MTPDEYVAFLQKKIDDLLWMLTIEYDSDSTSQAMGKLDLIVRAVKLHKKKLQVEKQLDDLGFVGCGEEYDWGEPETDPSDTTVQAA